MPLTEDAQLLVASMNKHFGDNTVLLASDMRVGARFTTGSIALDVALGGGLPADQWTEVLGWKSAGKTAFALKTVAANQALDPNYTTFWVAAERFDYDQAAALGVDTERVIVAPTQDMVPAFSMMLAAMESKIATCIVLDSYTALLTPEEDEKTLDEFSMATGARMVGQWVKKSYKAGARDPRGNDPRFHGIFINQYRDKPGAFQPKFGPPPKGSPGGNAKDYFFYTQIEVTRAKFIEEKRPGLEHPVKVGQKIQWRTVKNKSAAPYQVAYSDYYFRGAPFTEGQPKRGDYDLGKEFVQMGVLFGVVERHGNWLHYGQDKWNGKPAMESAIRTDAGLMAALRTDVLEVASDPTLVDQIQPEEVENGERASSPSKRSARRARG